MPERSKKIYVEGIGDVEINRSVRAIRVSIRIIEKSMTVRLTVPALASYESAYAFLIEKKDWIHHSLNRLETNKKAAVSVIADGFSTRTRTLSFISEQRSNIIARLTPSRLIINYPDDMSPNDPLPLECAKKAIEKVWKLEAEMFLPAKIEELAAKYGFKYKEVKISRSVSRWGSCSPDNRISLSLHLMRLPDHLIDFVILHELCHTIHKNHSPRFHNELSQRCGINDREFSRQLKKYTTRW